MSNIQVVERALADFAELSRRDRYFELYSENIVLHGYGIDPGLDNVKRYYGQVWTAFPDARVDAEEMIEVRDRVILRFVMRATHRGSFLGVEPTCRSISVPGMTILRFEEERCVERWSVTDGLALLAQLGALKVSGQ